MSLNDLIFGLLIGLFFGFLNNLDKKPPKNYNCPKYCAVIHVHIGVKDEKKEPNEQGPLSGDKWLAYDDESTNEPDTGDIGSNQ